MQPLDTVKLLQAMNWVIPPDRSSGAGTPETLAHLLDLIEREDVGTLYFQHLAALSAEDLLDRTHPLGSLLVEHVRDVYYAHTNTGAWADIGFKVSG